MASAGKDWSGSLPQYLPVMVAWWERPQEATRQVLPEPANNVVTLAESLGASPIRAYREKPSFYGRTLFIDSQLPIHNMLFLDQPHA